jgi:hypothetical protein
MEKITKIYIEVKKSKNFQTYTAGMEIEFEEPITPEEAQVKQRKFFGLCRQEVVGQMRIDGGSK